MHGLHGIYNMTLNVIVADAFITGGDMLGQGIPMCLGCASCTPARFTVACDCKDRWDPEPCAMAIVYCLFWNVRL